MASGSGTFSPSVRLPGWGERIRTLRWRVGMRTLSPIRERRPNYFPLGPISCFETTEFREPYRMGGVQRFGEKRAFRRKIGRLCQSAVQSSDWECLRLLDSV